MKKTLLISILMIVSAVLSSQVSAQQPAQEPAQTAPAADPEMKDKRGYFFGYSFGNVLRDGGNEDVDVEMLVKGLRDSLAGNMPSLTQAEQEAVIAMVREKQQAIVAAKQAAQEQEELDNLQAGKEYLAINATAEGVIVTDSGLQFLELTEGTGASPGSSDRVSVHYEGRLISGKIFDSSRQRGQPAEFGLQQVIAGWTEGLQLMKVGGTYRLFVPSELAYGPGGVPGIPPNSVLIFDVELLDIIAQ